VSSPWQAAFFDDRYIIPDDSTFGQDPVIVFFTFLLASPSPALIFSIFSACDSYDDRNRLIGAAG